MAALKSRRTSASSDERAASGGAARKTSARKSGRGRRPAMIVARRPSWPVMVWAEDYDARRLGEDGS